MTGFFGVDSPSPVVTGQGEGKGASSPPRREEHVPVTEPRQVPDPAQAGIVMNTIFIPTV